jgi:hypothetical protein
MSGNGGAIPAPILLGGKSYAMPMPHRHTPDLIAPELYSNGSFEYGTPTAASAYEAETLFGREDQESLRIATVLMMATLPGALDYIRAAPVMVLASTIGAGLRGAARQRLFLARAREHLRPGIRLRDLLRNLRVAYPLRALSAAAFSDGHFGWTTIRRLSSSVPLPLLGQSIPREPLPQFDWLRALMVFNRATAHRIGRNDRQCRWAAAAFGRALSCGGRLPEPDGVALAARYLFAHPEFNERWSIERVVGQAAEWQYAGRLRQLLDDKLAPPDVIELGPLSLVALRTKGALIDEGNAMRHCLGSCFPSIGLSFFYSVREHGCRIATLELERFGDVFEIAQLRGPGNSPVDDRIADDIRVALSRLATD